MTEGISRSTQWISWAALVVALVGAAVAWLAFDPGFKAAPQAPSVSDMPKDEFERRVRAYILENPEVVAEAIQALDARRRAAERTETQSVLAMRAEEVFRDSASPVGGSLAGDVSLVEFFDYNCPYCRRVAPVMAEAEKGDPQLRVVYKEFPILGPNSMFAAKAALAAHRQERYVAFHQALMQVKGTVDEAVVLKVAAQIGLDVERLKSDMQDAAIQDAIDRNLELAAALRINGTPSFVVGEQIVRGAVDLETLRKLIGESRAKK